MGLVHFDTPDLERVRFPGVSSCQSIMQLPYQEINAEHPKAVVGSADLYARNETRKLIDADMLSFTVPWTLFQEMESNMEESILNRDMWRVFQQ